MKKNFTEFASQSFKKLIQSPKLTQILKSGQEFFLENKTQLLITAGLLTTLAIMNKSSSDDKEEITLNESQEIMKQDIDNVLQTSSSNQEVAKQLLTRNKSLKHIVRPEEDTEKTNVERNHLNEELKKSQKQLNRRINKNMKIKGILGGYKCDQTFDESSEDNQVRSPDYSIVSDLDTKYFADNFQNKRKAKKNYQTDYDSDNCLTFLRQKKHQMLKIANEQKQGADKLFFKLYAQVAVQENQEDEDD